MLIALIIVSIFAVFMTILFLSKSKSGRENRRKYNTKLEELKTSFIDEKKIGYYNINHWTSNKNKINFNVFVEELDRYTNGKSKLKIDHIEILTCPTRARNNVKLKVAKEFSSIMETSDIEWLISEDQIKEIRRRKLETIEKLLENDKD